MATLKPTVVFDPEKHLWQVQTKDAQGNTRVSDSMESIEAMPDDQSVKVYLNLASMASGKRIAAVSLLARIMEEFLPSLEAWRGNGNPKEPLDNQLKGTFQRCEAKFFERYLDPKHPMHGMFVGNLPKLDGRGKSLEITPGKPNIEGQFDAFLTLTRKDPSYGNAKNTVLSYFSLIGRTPIGDDGRLIPPEAMAVMVKNARIIEQADNSFKGKLAVLFRILTADSEEGDKPTDEDIPAIEAMLSEMLDKVKELAPAAATRLQARLSPSTIVKVNESTASAAKTMIDKAQEAAKVKPFTTAT